jgi:hypothetical protein
LGIAPIIVGTGPIATGVLDRYGPRVMGIRFVEIHTAADGEQLNTEWVVLENDGKLPFNTRGCGMTVGKKGTSKRSVLGIIDPGFVLQPGERVRMLTGKPGTKAHGDPPPEEGMKNYFLLLPKTYVNEPGTVLTLTLRGLAVSKATFDPEAPGCVAPAAAAAK